MEFLGVNEAKVLKYLNFKLSSNGAYQTETLLRETLIIASSKCIYLYATIITEEGKLYAVLYV